jgi:hypothetical protein
MSIGLILLIILIIVLLGGVSRSLPRLWLWLWAWGYRPYRHRARCTSCAPSSGSDPLMQDMCLALERKSVDQLHPKKL